MSIIIILILYFVCMALYRPGLKFFLLWFTVCAAVFHFYSAFLGIWGVIVYFFIWCHDGHYEEDSATNNIDGNQSRTVNLYDKIYEDGSHRIENLSNTGYYYSDGKV